ncbi:uncharacterized protein LOC143035124 [Oratosquilla oratoria]|uniref:uncharacterized protein LOC143035124 n=1 Tax=Oratosquilla oratoria TaxID=337810 RepID=UPI003F7691F6
MASKADYAGNIKTMASSSVSQDDVEVDFEISSRRSRIRTARARNINPSSRGGEAADEECDGSDRETCGGAVGGTSVGLYPGAPDHDASPKPATRLKEKRLNRPNHTNKGKQQRDRRKLREKRRSTGVVHLPSTESTGGSTNEDEELLSMTPETRRNTHYNENIEKTEKTEAGTGSTAIAHEHKHKKSFTSVRNKSPSDLEADDEDNQDYDSLTMSDSTLSLVQPYAVKTANANASSSSSNAVSTGRSANGRPATPTSESVDELLERAREENRRLLCLLEERDHRISSLESRLSQLTGELSQASLDRSNLRQENTALIRAMASLAAK